MELRIHVAVLFALLAFAGAFADTTVDEINPPPPIPIKFTEEVKKTHDAVVADVPLPKADLMPKLGVESKMEEHQVIPEVETKVRHDPVAPKLELASGAVPVNLPALRGNSPKLRSSDHSHHIGQPLRHDMHGEQFYEERADNKKRPNPNKNKKKTSVKKRPSSSNSRRKTDKKKVVQPQRQQPNKNRRPPVKNTQNNNKQKRKHKPAPPAVNHHNHNNNNNNNNKKKNHNHNNNNKKQPIRRSPNARRKQATRRPTARRRKPSFRRPYPYYYD